MSLKVKSDEDLEKELIKYFKSLGINVNTTTKARGHQGFCLKNRIDISKMTPKNKKIQVLLHEFAHYIHSKLESDVAKTGGTLKILFKTEDKVLVEELFAVTNFIDENSKCEKLKLHKKQIKSKIITLENIIRIKYPQFLRSKKFKEFDKYIKKSKAKYLLKFDKVKVYSWFMLREEIYSINNLEKDFPQMPREFMAYIRLKSMQRKQTRISSRINKLNKYYKKPTELFARFVEGFYISKEETEKTAPNLTKIFSTLLEEGYYLELKNVFEICNTKIR